MITAGCSPISSVTDVTPFRVDTFCERGIVNEMGRCPRHICPKEVEEPKQKDETNVAFYKRMDEKHWRRG